MAPRIKERGKVVPVRNLEVERAGCAPGPVIVYYLSPEEHAKYKALPSPKPIKERMKHMTTSPSKVDFLKLIAAGKSISAIEREWEMAQGSLSYWVRKWDLKGIDKNRAQILLEEMQIDSTAPKPPPSSDAMTQTDEGSVNGRNKDKNESDRLRAEIAKVNEQIGKANSQIDEHLKTIENLKSMLAETQNGNRVFDAQGYITLRIPIIDGGWDRFEQAMKVHEELDEFGAELEALRSLDRRRTAAELFDVIQSYAGLIRSELVDLLVTGDVDEKLIAFFQYNNEEHEAKIRRYAAERNWKLVSNEAHLRG